MTSYFAAALAGAAGLCSGVGIWILISPWIARGACPRWRIEPYLQVKAARATPWRRHQLRVLGALSSSQESVSRRLRLARWDMEVSRFRSSQLKTMAIFATAAVFICVLGAAGCSLNPLGAAFMLATFPVIGVMLPDYRLTLAAKRRQLRLNQELPDAIELLALAIGAGESLYAALQRVAARCTQVAGEELQKILEDADSGLALSLSLNAARNRNDSDILSHLVDAIVSALERGSPLVGVLRGQVADSRSAARTQMLAEGGKKEILMMLPVVFLILPLTVVFALYPGLIALEM